jgi:ribonucleoside-triphosphate reductase
VCKNHGYLTGEQFVCPECGESAEVYSRITGYYRPVQNWNAGKTQEYNERREYNIETSVLNRPAENKEEVAAVPATQTAELADGSYLFTSATCPNCKIACTMMDKAGYVYEKLLATDNIELTNALGIKQAPTLVVVKNGEVEKFAGVGAIKKGLGL